MYIENAIDSQMKNSLLRLKGGLSAPTASHFLCLNFLKLVFPSYCEHNAQVKPRVDASTEVTSYISLPELSFRVA